MKKCPTCEKTFEDSMRFCQIDGTPLVDGAPPFDPYATIVARPGDAAVTTPPEPTRPHVEEVSISPMVEPEEVLDLPKADPLRTMYVSETEMKQALGDQHESEEPNMEIPADPEPPKFIAPEIPTPDFGEMAPPPSPFAVIEPPTPPAEVEPGPELKATTPPIPSPFDAPPSPFEPPPAFAEAETMMQPFPPASPFEQAEPIFTPAPEPPPFKEPEPVFPPVVHAPFEQQSSPAEWTPPPAPVSNWQNQEIGQNTPFQPPPLGAMRPSSILAIVSLVLGVLGLLSVIPTLIFVFCGILPFFLGIGAAITGFLARSRASSSPDQYGGKGMATIGIVLGVLDVLAPFAVVALTFLIWGGLAAFGSLPK